MVNREFVDLSFFPFPYQIALPKFLLVIIAFALGLIVGGLFMSSRISQAKRDFKKEHQRVRALENEVRSMHSQKHALPD